MKEIIPSNDKKIGMCETERREENLRKHGAEKILPSKELRKIKHRADKAQKNKKEKR